MTGIFAVRESGADPCECVGPTCRIVILDRGQSLVVRRPTRFGHGHGPGLPWCSWWNRGTGTSGFDRSPSDENTVDDKAGGDDSNTDGRARAQQSGCAQGGSQREGGERGHHQPRAELVTEAPLDGRHAYRDREDQKAPDPRAGRGEQNIGEKCRGRGFQDRDGTICGLVEKKNPSAEGLGKPTTGFEPVTCCLRNSCSTTEPRRRNVRIIPRRPGAPRPQLATFFG